MLYPLRFKEILRNYTFGGRWMPKVFAKTGLPKNHTLAETWEVCDRPIGESSVVTNGSLKGKSLHELIGTYKNALLGNEITARFGNKFPLLIKFLDATYPLGEQAHHSDVLARKQGLVDPGKTEAWYMIKTKPGATLRCGNKKGVTRQKLFKALMLDGARDCMPERTPKPGQPFLLYAGTMHYSAGGLLFYEIMQNSDVYIGLGKFADDLPVQEKHERAKLAIQGVHLEDNFNCAITPVTIKEGAVNHRYVLACNEFALERYDSNGEFKINCDGRKFYVLSCIEGECVVTAGKTKVRLLPGNSCLLPASIGAVQIKADRKSALLKGYVPNLKTDIVEPLRARGISDKAIIGLGGKTRLNPMPRYL